MPLPDKIYFKIGEVARLTGVPPYVLRFWETEFKAIQPVKSRSRQRLYRKRDVELILKIKDLLYAQRFTIEGARKSCARSSRGRAGRARRRVAGRAMVTSEALRRARTLAHEILALVSRPLESVASR